EEEEEEEEEEDNEHLDEEEQAYDPSVSHANATVDQSETPQMIPHANPHAANDLDNDMGNYYCHVCLQVFFVYCWIYSLHSFNHFFYLFICLLFYDKKKKKHVIHRKRVKSLLRKCQRVMKRLMMSRLTMNTLTGGFIHAYNVLAIFFFFFFFFDKLKCCVDV
ncbi:hypothetical protein RFI_37633, partial [Reticulomyxa filosa]